LHNDARIQERQAYQRHCALCILFIVLSQLPEDGHKQAETCRSRARIKITESCCTHYTTHSVKTHSFYYYCRQMTSVLDACVRENVLHCRM